MGGIKNSQEAWYLQQLVNGANNYLQSTDLLNTHPVPRVNHKQHSIGSKRLLDDCKMKQSLPRVIQPTTRDKMPHNDGPPASRTQSKNSQQQNWECSVHKNSKATKTLHSTVIKTHEENGKWGPQIPGGNGRRNRQGIKLPAADAKPKT